MSFVINSVIKGIRSWYVSKGEENERSNIRWNCWHMI